jgi:hypothetical protein
MSLINALKGFVLVSGLNYRTPRAGPWFPGHSPANVALNL